MNTNIQVMVQGFYGNRTVTYINKDDFDYLMLGILDKKLFDINDYQIDRSIIKVPNTENIIIVYNKFKEKEYAKYKGKAKETVNIPELGIKLYSRCIVCRMNNGEIDGLQEEDFDKFIKYLAE